MVPGELYHFGGSWCQEWECGEFLWSMRSLCTHVEHAYWYDFGIVVGQLLSETNLDPKVPTHIVVGLNPPFGVKSAMAIKFIQHSLQFMPRVIVLIVPQVRCLLMSIHKCFWNTQTTFQAYRFEYPAGKTTVTGQCIVPDLAFWWTQYDQGPWEGMCVFVKWFAISINRNTTWCTGQQHLIVHTA